MSVQSMQAAHQVATSLVNGPVRAQAPVTGSSHKATATSDATGSSTASEITSNDFLTLLVSELKNQDPTQPTDPNAYVQQLVGVNSLQQLISINQGITKIEDGSTPATTSIASQPI